MLIKSFEKIKDIVSNAENVAVVGISPDKKRTSYTIANKIKDKYTLFFVNPKYAGEKILNNTVYSSLSDINIKIDIVDVFRNPLYIEPIIKDAISIDAKTIWFQPGSENSEIISRYKDKIDIIQEACLGIFSRMD
jgi:predicted CoA-binding protein